MPSHKKTQKKSMKIKRGAGLFSTDVKTYDNLSYPGSGFVLPKLVCPVKGCGNDKFKNHVLKLGTTAKSYFLNTDVFDNSYNAFTCVNCGHVQFYSRKLGYKSDKLTKKK